MISLLRCRDLSGNGSVRPEHCLLESGDGERLLPTRRARHLDQLLSRPETDGPHLFVPLSPLLGVGGMEFEAPGQLVIGDVNLCPPFRVG